MRSHVLRTAAIGTSCLMIACAGTPRGAVPAETDEDHAVRPGRPPEDASGGPTPTRAGTAGAAMSPQPRPTAPEPPAEEPDASTPERPTAGSRAETCVSTLSTAFAACADSFCGPSFEHLVVEGVPPTVVDGPLGRTVIHETERVTLSWLLGTPQTDPSEHAAFVRLTVDIRFAVTDASSQPFVIAGHALTSVDDFAALDLSAGRAQGSVRIEDAVVRREVSSTDPACSTGDIAGSCLCEYQAPTIVDVDFDVPLT